MLQSAVSLFMVLALAFFVSRLLHHLPLFPASELGLRLVHVASWLGIVAFSFALKFPAEGFVPRSAITVGLFQLVWYAVDRWKKRLPKGKPA